MNPSDLVHIPYTPDMVLAGILYACRSLALGTVRASNLRLNSMRELSAEIAAELSLRRYLTQEHLSFKTLEAEPFTHPERNEIILGGRPCHVINTSITRGQHLRHIQATPAALLSLPAYVSEATLISAKWEYQDLLIFTFTLGASKPAMSAPARAQSERDRDYLIYIFPEIWRNAKLGGKTPGIALQNAGGKEITIEIGGRATNRGHVSRAIQLPPGQPVTVAVDFTNLAYLSTWKGLSATISARHPTLNRTLHISPDRWGNLWVDGIEIILAGYIEAGEFRRYARHQHASNHLLESGNISQHLSLPLQDLLPLPQLMTWLRAKQNLG